MSAYDRDIFQAIKGHPEQNPQDLPGILAAVDAFQRLILTHEELVKGVARLIEAGQVVEAGSYRYYVPKASPSVRNFSGIPLAEYHRACEDYHERFSKAVQELESDPPSPEDKTRQKIVVRWGLARQAYASDSDEDAIEPLIEMIHDALQADGRAEVIGCEHGPGSIDVLIFGTETDADTDDIYAIVLPVVTGFGCPPGSCIIRQYEDPKREVITDVSRRN
jgi:hypothetical protein